MTEKTHHQWPRIPLKAQKLLKKRPKIVHKRTKAVHFCKFLMEAPAALWRLGHFRFNLPNPPEFGVFTESQ
ncbi:hypothetical protein [Ectothiorhodospira sp. PHS-1]|uniref:hypothetical protein n=1 Tax=Ectothiorhodospira sp. PHS-1 TaxID=519989 RepID=UPI0011456E1B|nr:hypothetical protein [Ectothiorhodospira sp. PHS-1]